MTQVMFFVQRQHILYVHSSSALVHFQPLTLKLQCTLISTEWWLAVTDADPRTTWATRCGTPLPADVTLTETSGLWGWPLFSSLYEGCAYFQPLVRPNVTEGVVKHILRQLCRRGLWRSEGWVSAALSVAQGVGGANCWLTVKMLHFNCFAPRCLSCCLLSKPKVCWAK